jgi:hypothetical protein
MNRCHKHHRSARSNCDGQSQADGWERQCEFGWAIPRKTREGSGLSAHGRREIDENPVCPHISLQIGRIRISDRRAPEGKRGRINMDLARDDAEPSTYSLASGPARPARPDTLPTRSPGGRAPRTPGGQAARPASPPSSPRSVRATYHQGSRKLVTPRRNVGPRERNLPYSPNPLSRQVCANCPVASEVWLCYDAVEAMALARFIDVCLHTVRACGSANGTSLTTDR